MRKSRRAILSTVVLAIVAAAGSSRTLAAGTPGAWKGIVTDDQCAKNGLAKAGDAACPQHCVANGAKYALYDPATKKAYALNPQEKLAALAGKRVNVTGTLDGTVIAVANITVTPKK